ncbi:hypothetical protein GEMRC1_010630 [Eukaryota sp. GEM-RC1]
MINQFKDQLSQQTVDFSRLDTDHNDLLDRFEAVAEQKSRLEDQLNSLKELLNEQSVVMEKQLSTIEVLESKNLNLEEKFNQVAADLPVLQKNWT